MSEHDADMYAKILGKVKNQIQALRIMLASIEVILHIKHKTGVGFKHKITYSQKVRKGSGFVTKPQVIWMKERLNGCFTFDVVSMLQTDLVDRWTDWREVHIQKKGGTRS